MKNLYENGLSLMIASSSPASSIEEVMDTLKIKQYFKGYISGMQVSNPKPAPDIFLAAAEKLGLKPEECIVIEDSANGVNAADSAGMISIGFVNPNSGPQDLRKAAVLVEGFEEVDYQFVQQTYRYAGLEPEFILSTERLTVRELAVSDIEELHRIYRSPEVNAFLEVSMSDPKTEMEKHKAYIKNVYHFYGYGLWGVFLKENQRLIGRCGIEYKILDGKEIYEIGYLFDRDYQGCGYAKECTEAVISYAFASLDIPRITAVIDKRNLRSIRLAIKTGMKLTGECIRKQRECLIYEITR
jgi:RimJ/RimL family protein N-acetyltransferase